MNVRGRWQKKLVVWRKISLNTWSTPDNATIYGRLDVDVGPLQAYLKQRTEHSGVKCTMTHAVTRALAILLRRFPECNVLVRRRKIWLRQDVDIFHQVAMPIDPARGKADLSGAVVRRADTKKIETIASELRERAEQVRARKDGQMAKTRKNMLRLPGLLLRMVLKVIDFFSYTLNRRLPSVPHDPFGGAMVSTVGGLGIKMAYAPLVTFSHAPIIVLVGAVEDRPVVRAGQVVIRPMCTLTATLDHRVLDGFQGGRLAAEMQRLLEQPALLDEPPADQDGPGG